MIANPRDIRSAIAFETQTHYGQIPGVVDARATLCEQELSCDSTLFVVSEPALSLLTRRNHVLAWVLREAESLALSAIRRHKLGPDQDWIHARVGLLERAARTRMLREVMLSPAGRRRPAGAAIRDARKSLSPLYRMAADSMLLFEGIERVEPDAIRAILSNTLIAQLEDWQKLELATALAAAEALAAQTGDRVRWKGSIAGGSEIASVGRYRVRWQNALPKRTAEHLDPSEAMIRETAEALRAGMGLARADVSIRDADIGMDVAHFECKWFGSPLSASAAIVDAISQLVRYCRDSRPGGIEQAQAMLRDCVVVCSGLSGFEETLDGSKPVGLTDFSGLASGTLATWAARLHCRLAIYPN
ncbi:hypothetical protein [Burkholderia sp. Bp9143]|uniref:hypothetical protein n=1 Tax=Burkholderia sp. Bp9143 TaxID=2184574 RepID=UPI000F598611|nr:hypothetical protein [Burkholderia sp. Bp9143]